MKPLFKILRSVNLALGFSYTVLGILHFEKLELLVGIYFLVTAVVVIPILDKCTNQK